MTCTFRFKFFAALCLIPVIAQLGCSTGEVQQRELTKTERARMFVQIANGALVEGDPTGALHNLLKAEEEDANLPELYHSKALAYYGKHDLDSALHAVRKAILIKPNYAEANNTFGKLLIDAGKYEEAEKPLKVAANDALYRDSYKAWINLGILKYRRNDLVQSELYLNHAIQDAPSQACIAYYYRGHIRLKDQKLNEAIRDYSQATKKLCAHFGEAHVALGLAYKQNQQIDLARKTFLEIQKRYPNTRFAEQAMEHLRYLP
jgi:Tfp pilus assembly protein PilF